VDFGKVVVNRRKQVYKIGVLISEGSREKGKNG
jgi:hypothetical protein